MAPVTGDIFVVTVEHQITYMDAKFAAVEFGVKYAGLPQLKITNLLNDQIDAAADAVTEAISAPLKDGIDEAFEKFEEMLSDSFKDALDPIIDEAAGAVFGDVYDQLEDSYQNSINGTRNAWRTGPVAAILQNEIYGGNPVSSSLAARLAKLSDVANGLSEAESFVEQLQDATGKLIIGIDTIANQVAVVGGDPVLTLNLLNLPGNASDGLLHQENGEYQIVSNLVRLLLESLVEPEVAAIIGPLLDSATSELNAELNAQLEEIEPTLGQVVDALNQVRVFLVDMHGALDTSGALIAQVEGVIDDAIAGGAMEDILVAMRAIAEDQLDDLIVSSGIPSGGVLANYADLFDDLSEAEFVAFLKAELTDQLIKSEIVSQFKFIARQNLYDLEIKFRGTLQSSFDQLSDVMKEVISNAVGALESEIAPMLGDVADYMGSAEISGFAEFNGDSLRKLRMDLAAEFKVPDAMQLHAFLEIFVLTSEDNFTQNGCIQPGEKAVEVRVGALDVPFDWISDGLRASLMVKMSLKDEGSGMLPNGVGGSFELTGGVINFQTVQITCLGAAVTVGFDECYLAAKACVTFNNYGASAGFFAGRSCTLEPIQLVAPDIGELLDPGTTFTGVYVYFEVWLPISELVTGIPASCMFRVSAGVGFGAGFFIEGPTFVANMLLGVSGEALCIVSIEGIIKMAGVLQDGKLKASGSGSFEACIGVAFIQICFSAIVEVQYNDGSWAIDY